VPQSPDSAGDYAAGGFPAPGKGRDHSVGYGRELCDSGRFDGNEYRPVHSQWRRHWGQPRFGYHGLSPGILVPPYVQYTTGAVPLTAENDLTTAFNDAAGLQPTQTLTGEDLGGQPLEPGVYFFASSAQLTGTLTLNDMGDPNAQFVFQIGSTLTTASNSAVVTINGGANPGSTVFWQVGSSATLGTGTAFEGNILAYSSITMDTGASLLDGSALASNGAVTLDDNSITDGVSLGAPVPEPASAGILTLAAFGLLRRRHRTS